MAARGCSPSGAKAPRLETLVRKCVPQMPLEEVLAYICSHGEATLYKGDRVALLGSAASSRQERRRSPSRGC